LLGAVLGTLLVCPTSAQAFESEVEATSEAQFYTYQSPYGEPLIRRRRYTETLALHVYDLQGEGVPGKPRLSLKTRLRLDADFGQEARERNPESESYVPGLEQAPLDVMYAYLEGRDYAGGYLGFRIGRQYVTDVLGWWSFDGGLVSLTTPAYLEFQAYGGFEQRSGVPLLGRNRFEADGVRRGNRDGLELDQDTSYLAESKLAPAYGAAVETAGLHFLHARLSYRKVINRDTVVVSPFPVPPSGGLYVVGGDRVSSERAGGSLRVDIGRLGTLYGNAVYDLYNQLLPEYALGLDAYATSRITLGADYEYYQPTFDADSVFNWFAHQGMSTVRGRASVAFTRRLDAALSGGVRRFNTEGDPETYAATGNIEQTGVEVDPFATLGARYRWTDGNVGLSSMAELGDRGHRVGGDVTTRKYFDNGYWDTLLVLSLYDWQDDLRPTREATSFSYVVGAGVSPGLEFIGKGRLGVEWEHAINDLVGQRYRVLATLGLSFYQ
jgi:hypothetical protein